MGAPSAGGSKGLVGKRGYEGVGSNRDFNDPGGRHIAQPQNGNSIGS